MSNYLLGFPNKKERDDFFIAIVVILFVVVLNWIRLATYRTGSASRRTRKVTPYKLFEIGQIRGKDDQGSQNQDF